MVEVKNRKEYYNRKYLYETNNEVIEIELNESDFYNDGYDE